MSRKPNENISRFVRELWREWFEAALAHSVLNSNGTAMVPAGPLKRWRDLATLPYEELTSREREYFEKSSLHVMSMILGDDADSPESPEE